MSRRLAPAGYAYLLVWDGRATLATCLFTSLTYWQQALADTVGAFQRLVPGLDLADAQPFGGYGGVRFPTRYTDAGGRLYAGEAAGLQDPEWGFGMGFAMTSGALAAASLLDGQAYAARSRRRFEPARRAGLVNRALFEALPQPVIDALLRHEASRADLRARLAKHWAGSPGKELVARLLQQRLRSRLHDTDAACGTTSCTCVRCRCRNAPRTLSSGSGGRAAAKHI